MGAGPCGIAVGAAARSGGLSAKLIDEGCITSSLVNYPYYMTFFSTAEKLEIEGVPFTIAEAKPTPREALAYTRRVVRHYDLEIHRLFAMPLAPLVFSFFAVALGAARQARSRPGAVLVGILLAFAYYASISFSGLMAEKAWISAPMALWVPTAAFALLGIALLRRIHKGAA